MPVEISKGRIFRVTTAIDDARLKAMRRAPEHAQAALTAGAVYWHTGILPEHFKPGAGGKYGYAPRSRGYLKSRNKSGKPPLVLSGSLRRDVKTNVSIKATAKTSVAVNMKARVLNLAPALPQDSADLFVKRKATRQGYPNLKRELKQILPEERKAIADVVQIDLAHRFDPSSRVLAGSAIGEFIQPSANS